MEQWLLAGYRKNNVADMLDRYRDGIPERSPGYGNDGGGWGLGNRGGRAKERYRYNSAETPEEQARLDAEWEALVRRWNTINGQGKSPSRNE